MLAAIVLLATLLAGCTAPAGQGRLVERDHENDLARDREITDRRLARENEAGKSFAAGAPDTSEASTAAALLAEQSQRDVDLLLQARRDKAASGIAQNAATSPPADWPEASSPGAGRTTSPSIPPRRVVVWNETKRPAPAAPTSATALPQNPAPANAPSAAPTSQPEANAGSNALQPDRMKQLAVDLARELYSAGAYSEQPLRELVVIAAMNMVDADRKLDPAAIPDLTDQERAVLLTLQTFFTDLNASLQSGAPDDVQQRVADAAAKLRQSLVHEPQLKLPTVALCTRVGGFGDYAPFDHYAFTAGAEQKAIVYLEIDDFVSEINDKGEYVTELSQQLTIYSDRDGIPAWTGDWQTAVDVTKNKRQDFFTVQGITLPKNLSVGKYTLKLRVRDEKSKAEAETSVGLEIGVK